MEMEKGYIMAIDLEGEYDPESRVIVGDLLAIMMRRHWKVLENWEGDLGDIRDVVEDLDQLVYKYNETGAF